LTSAHAAQVDRDELELPPDPEAARLPEAARDVLWLTTSAEGEMVPPSNFGAMVAALSGTRVADGKGAGDDWHTVHRTGSPGAAKDARVVAPRAFAAAAKARRIARALERTHGPAWRRDAYEIAGWLLEGRRLPSLGIAAGAAPLTRAARVGWARYVQATSLPGARSPQSIAEWLVRLDARARAGKPVEARLAREVAREAEVVLHAALAGLGRTR
jgi:hypothetical protein